MGVPLFPRPLASRIHCLCRTVIAYERLPDFHGESNPILRAKRAHRSHCAPVPLFPHPLASRIHRLCRTVIAYERLPELIACQTFMVNPIQSCERSEPTGPTVLPSRFSVMWA